jgi:hypothetical protein
LVLSEDMIIKRLLWDLAPHKEIERIAEYLRLQPASEEILDKEHYDSHERLERVFIIGQPLGMLALVSARVTMATMNVMNDAAEAMPVDSEDFTDAVDKLEMVLGNAALAMIAQLVDWGLLHTPHVITMEEYQERLHEHREATTDDDEEAPHE